MSAPVDIPAAVARAYSASACCKSAHKTWRPVVKDVIALATELTQARERIARQDKLATPRDNDQHQIERLSADLAACHERIGALMTERNALAQREANAMAVLTVYITERDALAAKLQTAIDALENIAKYCDWSAYQHTGEIARDALAKLDAQPAKECCDPWKKAAGGDGCEKCNPALPARDGES